MNWSKTATLLSHPKDSLCCHSSVHTEEMRGHPTHKQLNMQKCFKCMHVEWRLRLCTVCIPARHSQVFIVYNSHYACSPVHSTVEGLGPSQYTPHPPTDSKLAALSFVPANLLEGCESKRKRGERLTTTGSQACKNTRYAFMYVRTCNKQGGK